MCIVSCCKDLHKNSSRNFKAFSNGMFKNQRAKKKKKSKSSGDSLKLDKSWNHGNLKTIEPTNKNRK